MPMTHRLTLCLLSALTTYTLLSLRDALADATRERNEAQDDLNTERLHAADLQRQVTAWSLWWERDGSYLMALANRQRQQGLTRLMTELCTLPPRTYTLSELEKEP